MLLKEIHKLVEAGFHEEALKKIKLAKRKGETNPLLLLFEALAVYDDRKDLECLRLLNQFLSKISSSHEKYHYALFTSGICLMNIGLPKESSRLFNSIPDDYPDIEKERRESHEALSIAAKAKDFAESIFKITNA